MSGVQKDPSPDAAETKKRRACDECRTRKLACTKEADGCRRCKREGIPCVYSAQKPMGRPRKRARSDEAEQPPNAAPSTTVNNALTSGMPDGDAGLSSLSEQVASPGLTFFDFLGMGDASIFDATFPQQQFQQQPQQDQSMDQSSGLFTSALATTTIPSLTPPATTRQSPSATSTHRYDTLFPRGLFGMNFDNIDFNPSSADAMTSGVPNPPSQNNNSDNNNSNSTASPSGGSDVPSLSNGSQSTQGNSPVVEPTRKMVTEELTPGMSGTNPNGWQPRHLPIGILPPSPKIMQQQMPSAPQDTTMSDANQLPPYKPKPLPVAEDQPTLLGGIPTSTPVDAYSKASAAWLLTAPNRICGCLARLYLALDSLQHLPTEVGPAMSVARNAAHTAHDTILCPSCSPPDIDINSRPPLQAFQNLMILGALLPSIAHTYRRIVAMVDEEAARATAAKVRLPLSLTEYGGVWGHMARWDNVCAQTTNMDNSIVEPPLWRLVVRAMLKMDVYGIHLDREDAEDDGIGSVAQAAMSAINGTAGSTPASQSSNDSSATGRPEGKATGPPKPGFFMVPVHFGLKDIAEMMEERAKMRHRYMDMAYDAGLIKTSEEGGDCGYRKLPPGEKHPCQKIIEMAKQEIDRLVIV
ncbi:hypothetical protein SBRCBS47491_002357 [Sporothrix bragantina]|uniref:Zn(2)-C6 fungal-type domain-containing protein n=1 Tax=Sporothrix bragantina TaxID=671064 RepID=A0ABP0B667_9PEZI